MFEFQTAISELTGLPVANASLYEGPSSVASAAYLALGRGQGAQAARRLARRCIRTARETLETYARGFGAEVVEVGLARRGHRPGRARRLRSTTDAPPSSSRTRTSSARSRTSRRSPPPRTSAGALCVAVGRRDHARRPAPAGRVRGRRRGRRGPAARQPARLRRPVVRVLRRDRGAPAPDAGPDRRRDHRRRRPPRLRARAADPRAAHPPREGDPQHLHLAGAERARRDDLPRLARPPRDRRARRAAGPPDRLRARAPGRRRRGGAAARRRRWRASSRSRLDAPVGAVLDRVSEEGIAAGYPLGREYPEYEDGLLVAITERRSKEDIDRLADALGGRSREPRRSEQRRRGARMTETRHPADHGRDPDAAAARARDDDLRALGRGPPRRRAPAAGRPRDAARRADPGEPAARRRPRACPRSPSPRSSATTTGSRGATSTSTPGPYPLGSCTMKHNPRLNEKVAALPGHARLHPAQDPKRAQGALELMWLPGAGAERDLRPAARLACSRRPARTASSPGCCSPAPTTRTAASSGPRC